MREESELRVRKHSRDLRSRRNTRVPLVAVEEVREPVAIHLAVDGPQLLVHGWVGEVERHGSPGVLVRWVGEVVEGVVFYA